jgi:hypothetical protein
VVGFTEGLGFPACHRQILQMKEASAEKGQILPKRASQKRNVACPEWCSVKADFESETGVSPVT